MTTPVEAPEAVELTEFEEIDVQKVSGVAAGANGFPHLMLKGIAPAAPDDEAGKAVVNGKVDQKPDIACGEKILALLGQAMGNESQEVAAGHHGETGDVHMLAQAHDIVHQWMQGEQTHPNGLKAAAATGCGCCPDCTMDTAKAAADDDAEKAKLTSAARDNLSDSDFAIPETRSYPIHDEAHARNALSRVAQNGTASEKARVRAAVHKKYPDIGADDSESSKSAALAEGGTTVEDVTQGNSDTIADPAVAKALEAHKAEISSLRDELAKAQAKTDAAEATVKAWASKPIPGGLVLSENARPQAETRTSDEAARKAAYYEEMASTVASPQDADGYRQLASREKAKLTAPA